MNACPSCGFRNAGERDRCTLCGEPVPRLKASLGPGDVIHGRFEVLGVLAVSPVSEVYVARHATLDVPRCVKVFRESVFEDEALKADFLREARIATGVRHPNVALVHDIDVTDEGRFYVVWEFVDGITVRHWSRRHGRWPYQFASFLAAQALDGLGHVHSKGLVHHNLTPDNLMVTVDSEGGPTVKIVDLGVGRIVEGSRDSSEAAARIGMVPGDSRYASPEQLGTLADGETIDGRSDQYCLAVVLYEMIAGRPVFGSPTPDGDLEEQPIEPPSPFAAVAPEVVVPEGLQSVVLRALQKDRDQRFGSAAELGSALAPWCDLTGAERDRMASMIEEDLPSRRNAPAPEDNVVDRKTIDTDSQALVEEPDHAMEVPEFGPAPPQTAAHTGSQSRPSGADSAVDGKDRAASGAVENRPAEQRRVDEEEELPEEEADWKSAVEEGTAEAWGVYIQAHPDSKRVERAYTRRDEAWAFQTAMSLDQLDAWNRFLDVWPMGPHRDEAVRHRDELAARLAKEREDVEREESADWERAATRSTVAAWDDYLAAHPSSERLDRAKNNRREAEEYEAAVATDDLSKWSEFISSWPDGAHATEAVARREVLERELENRLARLESEAWDLAVNLGTASAWEAYITEHGDSHRARLARRNHSEAVDFIAARMEGSSDAWEAFIDVWPDGPHAAHAIAALREVRQRAVDEKRQEEEGAWREAMNASTRDGWTEFLDRYPESDRADEARALRDQAVDFDAARRADTPEQWGAFLEKFPEGSYADEARESIAFHRDREAKAAYRHALRQGTAEALEHFIESWPESPYGAAVKDALAEMLDWEKLSTGEPAERDWDAFIRRWPGGPHADKARKKVNDLREARRVELSSRLTARLDIFRRRSTLLVAAIAVAIVALVVVGYLAARSPTVRGMFQKTPGLSIDALPWANVVSVRDSAGRDWLSSGARVTPVALFVPRGDYQVVLEYGSPSAKPRTVKVHVGDKVPVTVRENFAAVDAQTFFEESGW